MWGPWTSWPWTNHGELALVQSVHAILLISIQPKSTHEVHQCLPLEWQLCHALKNHWCTHQKITILDACWAVWTCTHMKFRELLGYTVRASSFPSPGIDFFISPGWLSKSVHCAGSGIMQNFKEKREKHQLILREGIPMMLSHHPSETCDATGLQYYRKQSNDGARKWFKNKHGSWQHITM